jgi:F0F1-type ATP synthase delta subunit
MNASCQPEFFDDVTRHYAKVMQDLPDTVLAELASFSLWAQAHPLRNALLKEESLPVQWHEAFFQEFNHDQPCQKITLRTLRVLSAQKRLENLPKILDLLSESKSDCRVYWHVAKKFSKSELSQFEKILQDALAMPVKVVQKEKPDLLLGGVLLWRDVMIDLSLNKMISNLHTEIDDALICS